MHWVQEVLNESEGVYYVTDHVDAEAVCHDVHQLRVRRKITVKGS